jgi:hypothetical protein
MAFFCFLLLSSAKQPKLAAHPFQQQAPSLFFQLSLPPLCFNEPTMVHGPLSFLFPINLSYSTNHEVLFFFQRTRAQEAYQQ